jgi:hypothetical protein
LLQGPHQPTYPTPWFIATAVAEWPAPRSKAWVQSAPDLIDQPLAQVQT